MNNISYIPNSMRSKFTSFVEKMKICLDKLEEPGIFNVWRNFDGSLWYSGARGKKKYGSIDEASTLLAMDILATMISTTVAPEHPFLEAEIPEYGHRFSGTIPPLSRSATFSIRKRTSILKPLEVMASEKTFEEDAIRIITESIEEKKNIMIVGGPNSGKTTLGNAVLKKVAEINPTDRIHVIEKTRELIISSEDYESWEIPPSLPGGKAHPASIQKIQELTLRRDPGRIVWGEIRTPDEAAALLIAWNSGQPGGITTIHADNATMALTKLEQYINSSLVMKANPDLIASTINIIISIQNVWLKDKEGLYLARRVEEILEVNKYLHEHQRYHTTPLYRHNYYKHME